MFSDGRTLQTTTLRPFLFALLSTLVSEAASFPDGSGKLPDELDKSAPAMKQGATRIERGRENFRRAHELARANGWTFNWTFVEAPGVGHDAAKMFSNSNAKAALFPERSATPAKKKSKP